MHASPMRVPCTRIDAVLLDLYRYGVPSRAQAYRRDATYFDSVGNFNELKPPRLARVLPNQLESLELNAALDFVHPLADSRTIRGGSTLYCQLLIKPAIDYSKRIRLWSGVPT